MFASADDSGSCGENLTWSYTEATKTLIISGTGAMDDGWPWGAYRMEIQNVIIEEGVTSIGRRAFYACMNMTSVTIPKSITSIGEEAFSYCSRLSSVHITDIVAWCNIFFGDNPIYLAQHLYVNGEAVTDLVIPNGVTSISANAFTGCTGLISVTLGDSVTTIENSAFNGCTGLTSVNIGKNVTTIGDYAFYNCTTLSSLTISDNVATIGNYAFASCTSLTSLTIGDNVATIGNYAFDGCTSLFSLAIGGKITTINKSTFHNCKSLSSLTIGDNITTLGDGAFSGCTALTSLTIPQSVTTIGNEVFFNCSTLISITGGDNIANIGRDAFTRTAWVGNQPNGLAYVGNALYLYKGTMPENTSIEIRKGTTCIAAYAFRRCKELVSVTIPNSVKGIGEEAFAQCSLSAINLPSSVEAIGHEAFRHCPSLATIIVDKDNKTFDSRNNCNAVIRTADNEMVLGCKNTTIPNTVTSLGVASFMGCDDITTIAIPNSVTTIDRTVFYELQGLTTLSFPNSVTNIKDEAIKKCSNLETVKIGSGLTTIGQENMERCENLKDLYIFARNIPEIEGFDYYSDNIDPYSPPLFEDTPIASATLHVPAELVENYKQTKVWNGFGNIVALTEEDIEEMNQASGVQTVMNAPNGQVESVYTIGGQRINKAQRSLNIIRTKDGKTKKVVVK